MANLRDRLKRIQEIKDTAKPKEASVPSFDSKDLTLKGWEARGFQTLKREVTASSPFKIGNVLPAALGVVVPDLAGRDLPPPENFLFFDLETTGLSPGAGTVAFLAAFGRLAGSGDAKKLKITQYLLLDYPGEVDFLDAILKEFTEGSIVVTYNGKCFDAQILKTRCLMNGIKPPVFCHADLLHPARRLWKNIIQNCSQASIETRVIGLDRSHDIPGAEAPEIWFEFLKTGKIERLTGICDHNISDISGLCAILTVMTEIARDPFGKRRVYDTGRLALYWHYLSRRSLFYGFKETGDKLLRFALEKDCPPKIKAAILRILSIESERRLKDTAQAIGYARQGLDLMDAGSAWKNDFARRLERLERKEALEKLDAD